MSHLRRRPVPTAGHGIRSVEHLEARMLLAGDLVAQWRADALNASTENMAVVSSWTDSVNSVAANLVSGSPVLAKGAINGRSAIRFETSDGVDGLQVAASSSPMRNRDDYTVVVVFATASQDLSGGEGVWYENSGLVDANNVGFGADWGVTINRAGKVSTGLSAAFGAKQSVYSAAAGYNDGSFHIAAVTRRGNTMQLYVDGQLSGSTTAADTAPRSPIDMAIGRTASGNVGFDGDLAELRFYDGQLSQAEITSLQQQLNSYYDNAPPTAAPDSYTFNEDFSFLEGLIGTGQGVLANDTDQENDRLTAVLIEPPAHGAFTLNSDGSFAYDSDANYFGTDSFTYAANDFRNSAPTTVTLIVNSVYDKAVATADEYKLLAGRVLNISPLVGLLANDLNPDKATLTAVVSQPPANGQVTLNGDGSFRYDPQGFAGRTFFEYQIDDGTSLSNAGRVTLIVNTPPEARNDVYTLAEDSPLITTASTGVAMNDFDAEGNATTATLIEGPTNGTLTLTADGSFSYTPNANYFGTDAFTYQLDDSEDTSNIATVHLTITAVNDAPVGVADTYFGLAGASIVATVSDGVLANDTDIEGNSLTALLVTPPQQGNLNFAANGSFTYTPPAGFLGTQTFTYRAVDLGARSEPTTVLLAINSLAQQQQIVINEVHVDPDIKTEKVEFVELYNKGDVPISLAGWALRDAVDYVFPQGSAIEPGGYLVVTQDPVDFGTKFGRPALGPWAGSLANGGETIELLTSHGDSIDSVDYRLGFPWPTYGELGGPSVQLINASFANDLGGNWRGAAPTPGEVNSVVADNGAPQMRQVNHLPKAPKPGEPVTITARVTDPEGVQSVSLAYQIVNPGDYILKDDPRYNTDWVSVAMVDNGQNGDPVANDGVYTVVLPANLQTNRRMIRYRVTSTDTLSASRTAPYEDDLQPNFAYYVYNEVPSWTGAVDPNAANPQPVTYDSELLNSVPVYHLLTTHTNHVDSQYIPDSALRGGYGGSDYQWQGTMVYDGEVYDHIGFRARGGVWRYSMGKNMWKFDFNRGHRFQAKDEYGNEYSTEWDKLNFSAIIQQGNFRHRGEQGLFESVGFELFNLAGTESPDTHYVQFRVVTAADENGADQYSGDFQGLYLAVEQPDGNFLDQHNLPDGNFFKIENNRAESVVNQGPDQVDDQTDVNIDFIRTFTARTKPDPDWWRANLDLDKYYGYQAISHAIHHYDTAFGKNFYYYSNPETGKWEIHPWDLDLTWADNMFGNENHEFNTQVAKNEDFNNYTLQANIDLDNSFNAEYQNRVREILDLLYNPEQTGMLIDQMASIVYQPGVKSLVDADRAMWDNNPINATASRYTNSEKNAVNWKFYSEADTKDFAGMIKILKDYVVTRDAWLRERVLTNEPNIPLTPTVTYTGAGFALNDLDFRASTFASPVGASFAGMEWRIGETTDVNAPGFDPYDRSGPRAYEIDANWESGLINEFRADMTVPSHSLEPGKTYRVRVRMLDNDGHWSHWSDPVQFQATAAATSDLAAALRVSEINYHPASPTPAESAAGIADPDNFEFIELVNISGATINLAGARLDQLTINGAEQGVDFKFAEGQISTLAPGARLLVVENLDAFQMRYGSSLPIAGQWSGGLSNSAEQITLSDSGLVIQQFSYSDAWHPTTDGGGASLEIVNAASSNLNSWGTAAAWQPSRIMGGTPGRDRGVGGDSPGDANRDGIFNSTDLVAVFAAGEYEDAIAGNSTWEEGDWNGDGDFTTSDLVLAFSAGAYSAASRPVELNPQAIGRALDAMELDALDAPEVKRPAAQLDHALSVWDVDQNDRPRKASRRAAETQ